MFPTHCEMENSDGAPGLWIVCEIFSRIKGKFEKGDKFGFYFQIQNCYHMS